MDLIIGKILWKVCKFGILRGCVLMLLRDFWFWKIDVDFGSEIYRVSRVVSLNN